MDCHRRRATERWVGVILSHPLQILKLVSKTSLVLPKGLTGQLQGRLFHHQVTHCHCCMLPLQEKAFIPSRKVQGEMQRPQVKKVHLERALSPVGWPSVKVRTIQGNRKGQGHKRAPAGNLPTCTVWPKASAELRVFTLEVPSQA